MATNTNTTEVFTAESLASVLSDDTRQDNDMQSLATILNTARDWDEWSMQRYPEEMADAFRTIVDEVRAIQHRNS